MLTGVLTTAVVFGAIVAVVYLSLRKKERMALLQSGHDASFFMNQNKKCFSSLKWGLLLFSVGIGILVADIFAKMNIMTPEAAYFSMAFIAGGIALIIDFTIERYRAKEQPENETP